MTDDSIPLGETYKNNLGDQTLATNGSSLAKFAC